MKTLSKVIILIATASFFTACGYQALPQAKNEVEGHLAEVVNQYKRRADVVAQIVPVVSASAKHEKDTLTAVTEARAHATQVTIDPSKASPEDLKKYANAQGELGSALGRLMMVTEKYPDLKANAQFQSLQSQLEGNENRIAVARNRYIEAIKGFNNLVTVPPTSWTNSMFYHFDKMPQWDVSEAERGKIEQAPEIKL